MVTGQPLCITLTAPARRMEASNEHGLGQGAAAAAPWPTPLREDRDQVVEADSVGVMVRKHQQEGRLVVFRGGWADLEYWGGGPSDRPVIEAPGWDDWMDLPGIERLLRRFAGLFE